MYGFDTVPRVGWRSINSDSSFGSNPGEAQRTAAKRILSYLKETKMSKLIYVNQKDKAFERFSDVDQGDQ